MEAVVIVPETENLWFLANLVDRPFLRHVVDFIMDQGIAKISFLGPAADRAQNMLSACPNWGASFQFRQTDSVSREALAEIGIFDKVLLASAECLPIFPLKRYLADDKGLIIFGKDSLTWTGWALTKPGDLESTPVARVHTAFRSWVAHRPAYNRVQADAEFWCRDAGELWISHKEAQHSNLATLHHDGIEVKPGIWVGRHASIASSATLAAPAYIGENSRISAGARVGPFAVVGRDCLISPHTTVSHAVVAPGTYAGDNLDLEQVFVDKARLFDIRSGGSAIPVDSAALGDVFDLSWLEIPGQMCGALALPVKFLFARALAVLHPVWQNLRRRKERVESFVFPAAPVTVEEHRMEIAKLRPQEPGIKRSAAAASVGGRSQP